MLGIFAILGVAFAFSKSRRAMRWRIVAWGLRRQFVVVLFALQTHFGC